MSELLKYLKFVDQASKGNSMESIVLKHGIAYPAPIIARPKGIKKGKDRQCFTNAYHICIENKGFKYIEGFALSIIPVHHAWVLDEDGNVIETTWKEAGEEYYGIELDIPWVNKVIYETKVYGALNPQSQEFRKKYL